MSISPSHRIITKEKFDAVLFDLDGVLTDTAKIHAACWKKMFDDFLQRLAQEQRGTFQPFDIATDYKHYVDGKLRYDGVRGFLESRGIHLPFDNQDDHENYASIRSLGNLKDRMVKEKIRQGKVDIYRDGVTLARHVRSLGLKIAVVSASKNCQAVLEAAGIADLFDVRVDGNLADELELPGKPAPDTFLKAAALLKVEAKRAVVVEDAISGVAAGRAGGFGFVVGVDRKGDAQALKDYGADIVTSNLNELIA
jgi:beta-phosphoglucomutase family hydrolase